MPQVATVASAVAAAMSTLVALVALLTHSVQTELTYKTGT